MPPLKKNEKIMLAGIGVMIVVFIVMDPYYFIYRDPPEATPSAPTTGNKPKPAAGGGAKPVQSAKPTEPAAPVVDDRPKREPVVFNNWGRDPFVQAKRNFDDAQAISGLKLGGISVKGSQSYALINKQIVRTGDMIEGLIVSRIEADRVLLTKGGATYTLTGGQR